MHLAPVDPLDLYVALPLPWPLYDSTGRLLLAEGAEIQSEQQMRDLLSRGLFRQSDTPPAAQAGPEPAPAQSAAASPAKRQAAGELPVEQKPLESTRITTGDTLQLQTQFGEGQARHIVTLIGYLKGKSLVVTAPERDGRVLLIREGQCFIARIFSGKSAYAFSSTVIKFTSVPYPHLHLSYPAYVEAVTVRRDARANVRLIAAVQTRHIPAGAAIVSDISTGGCSLLADSQMGLKDERIVIKVKVPVGTLEQVLALKGIIRAVQVEPLNGSGRTSFTHGIQFVDMPQPDQVALTAFVYQKLIEDELKL